MTDQHRFDAISFRGHAHLKTPHLDSLVARSRDFTAAYTQSPVCAPARYSLATGQYVADHGVCFNSINPRYPVRTIAHQLSAVGYRCFQAGHMHWSEETTDTGYAPLISREDWLNSLPLTWRERFEAEHQNAFIRTSMGGPSPLPESAFWGTYVAKKTSEFIDTALDDEVPFFAWASIYEPHPPFFPPAEVYRKYIEQDICIPKVEDKGSPRDPAQEKRRGKWSHLTDHEIRQMMAGYFGMVEVADRSVGSIIGFLDKRGILENTWIIWTSDHGEQLYDHGLFLKFCMYEESVHVPLTIAGPGIPAGVETALVEHVDLFPTLCEVAGLDVPETCSGRSLLPILQSPGVVPPDWRDRVYSQINDLEMVRSRDWKLVTRAGKPVELYDLANDPGETNNRVTHAELAGVIEELLGTTDH
jgi:choline-sulfatase